MANTFEAHPVYTADLSGAYEVPPRDSSGRGQALFRRVSRDRMFYAISATGLNDITEAHIHRGRIGQNGPVVAWLFGPSPGVVANGLLARGYLRRRDLTGPLAGRSLNSLQRLMRNGNAYVNIHTLKYPDGEIRGQVVRRRPSSSSSDWWQYGGMA